MKNTFLFKLLSAAFSGFAWGLALSFSAMAAVPAGTLEGADSSSIYGWAWDSDNYNHVIPIELSVYGIGSSDVLKTATVKADHYQDKLQESIGDGYHGFSYSIDWSQFDETQLRVVAYAVTQTERVFLGELTYNKETSTHTPVNNTLSAPLQSEGPSSTQSGPSGPVAGPSSDEPSQIAVPGQSPASQKESRNTPPAKETVSTAANSDNRPRYWQSGPGVTPKEPPAPEGISLGMFTVTGYCNCDLCSSGSHLTYSGTEPQADHTLAADINLFPMGTKLRIGDIIYTVEDIGSNVVDKKVDIYYATHEEAAAHGTQQLEVFTVPEA